MTETNGSSEPRKQKPDWLSRSYWLGVVIILLATWLVTKEFVAGEGWITVIGFVFFGWQGRGYAEKKLKIGE